MRIESDLSIPKDIDHITVDVTLAGKSLARFDDDIGADHVLLPAELSIGPTGSKEPVTVHGVAYKEGNPRIERSAVTAVPSGYVGKIRLPFDYLCDGTADADGDSTCPGEETCKIGTCEAAAVPPSEVIPVPPAGSTPTTRVDGGGGGKVDDGCFDVVACMAAGTRIPVDPDGCRLTLPSTYAPDHVNVAITLAPGSKGVCAPDGGSCYAVLSAGSGGWSLDGTTLTLPPGVCRGAQVPNVTVSNDCSSKHAETPVCGDWSSVPTPIDQPPSRPSTCDGELTKPCPKCGRETRTCTDGTLSTWSGCTGTGACETGEKRPCQITGATETCSDSCEWGSCACPDGQIACGKACVKADSREHCGTCKHDCSTLPHVSGTIACRVGACAFDASACAPGFADCDGKPENGCEADLTIVSHCGSCTRSCSGATGKCAAVDGGFQCVATCPDSTALCGSACTDTSTDARNCSTCGHACPAVGHAQSTCSASTCDFDCNAGYSRCGDACVDFTTDSAHCGSCATACSGGKVCSASQCTCPTGTHECSGACVSSNAVATCGASCSACPAPANGSATCGGTACGTTCNANFSACGAACLNLKTDRLNCGTCGNTCNGSDPCVNGKCSCTGVCTPGATQACGAGGTRTCSDGCGWGACAGQTGVTPFASGLPRPNFIAATATDIYWFSSRSYDIRSMPLAGGTTRTVATSVTTPNGLTSDGKNAYWTDCSACDFATGRSSTGSLGSTRQGVEAYGLLAPTAVAVDANNVYWVNGGTFTCQPVSGGWSVQWDNANGSSIAKWPLNGGSSSIVVENLNVHTASMASDGTTLYWSDFFGVYATSIDTGHTDTVEGRSSRNVAVDARFVYWIDATSGSSGNIMKLPKGSTTPIELAKQQSQTGYTLRLDASNVYWSDAGLGAIFSAPIAGGPAVRMFQQSLTIADFVEANGAFYIAVPGTAANDYQDGQIVKIAK